MAEPISVSGTGVIRGKCCAGMEATAYAHAAKKVHSGSTDAKTVLKRHVTSARNQRLRVYDREPGLVGPGVGPGWDQGW
jgi:hypothetical protein